MMNIRRLLPMLTVLLLVTSACEQPAQVSTVSLEEHNRLEHRLEANRDYLLHEENKPPPGQRGGIFVVGMHIETTHPNGLLGSGNRNVHGAQLNASLVRWNEDYEPVPYLATSWSFSEDGKTFRFELHPDACFHDGEDITCADVAFSIRKSQRYHPFKPMFAPVIEVTGGDTDSCAILMSKPHPALMVALSPGLLPIIPEHIYNDGQPMGVHRRLTKDVVGSGPFKLTKWDTKDIIRFVRNEDFFIEGLPYLDELVIDIVPDTASLTLGLETGDYDMVSWWYGDDIAAAKENPDVKVISKGFEAIGSVAWIDLNHRDPILSDVRVRQALAYATDNSQFNDIVYGGQHRLTCTGIQNQSPFYNPGARCYELDLDKARALLTEAGYPDGFSLTITTNTILIARAEVMREQWAKIGVDVKFDIRPDETTVLKEITKENADFQVTIYGTWNWGDPVIGVERNYRCDNRKVGVPWSNMTWYCNPAVDELFAQAGSEMDPEKRRELYFEVQALMNEDVPVIYLTNEVFSTRMQHSVENPPTGIWGWMDSWAETWVRKPNVSLVEGEVGAE